MNQRLSRILSAFLALALCMGLTPVPARAAGLSQSVQAAGATFTLTGDKLAPGAELTLTARGLDSSAPWSFCIHASKDAAHRYSLVGPSGQSEFYTPDEAAVHTQDALLAGSDSRTFTLTIPEEYLGWTFALRISAGAETAEIPLPLAVPSPQLPAVRFDDVAEDAWYYSFVTTICSNGWMSGQGSGRFNPEGQLLVSQALVLAARLYQDYMGAEIAAAEGPWYVAYYNYCLEHGVIQVGEFTLADMDRPATRFELVSVLDRAASESRTLGMVNPTLADGYIPDLAEADPNGEVVYRWYRAGILSGDEAHNFNGTTTIRRSEVAVILCQLLFLVDRAKL